MPVLSSAPMQYPYHLIDAGAEPVVRYRYLYEQDYQPSVALRDLICLLGIDFLLVKTKTEDVETITTTSTPKSGGETAPEQTPLTTPKSNRKKKSSKKKEKKGDIDTTMDITKYTHTTTKQEVSKFFKSRSSHAFHECSTSFFDATFPAVYSWDGSLGHQTDDDRTAPRRCIRIYNTSRIGVCAICAK